MRRLGAYRRLLIGLAGASLLLTIGFLAIAPAYRFDYPKLGCGSPALWYLNGRPGGSHFSDKIEPFSSDPTSLGFTAPACQNLVDQRLTWAAMSGTATVGLLLTCAAITRRSRSYRVWFTPLAA